LKGFAQKAPLLMIVMLWIARLPLMCVDAPDGKPFTKHGRSWRADHLLSSMSAVPLVTSWPHRNERRSRDDRVSMFRPMLFLDAAALPKTPRLLVHSLLCPMATMVGSSPHRCPKLGR
jgi:hypothetical protein